MSPHRRLLQFKQLIELGISFSRDGSKRPANFPSAFVSALKKIAWFEDEILTWVSERDAERHTPSDDDDE